MKSKALKYVSSILLIIVVISCFFMYVYIKNKNKVVEDFLIKEANKIINENISNENITQNDINLEESMQASTIKENTNSKISAKGKIIGKILIPVLDVEAPIEDGTTQDILKEAVGHFEQTGYWNGNVVLASHNRGTYAHYFDNIKNLTIGDEIIYQTQMGTKKYKVNEINQIFEDDLSVLDKSENNTMTLITCITGKRNLRLCVKAVEKT